MLVELLKVSYGVYLAIVILNISVWCILVITYESKVEKHIIYVTMNYDMCNLTQNLLIMIMEVDTFS